MALFSAGISPHFLAILHTLALRRALLDAYMGKLCVERCGRDSSHGDGTIGKRTHCATCAPQSMVNLKNPRCRLCTKRASKGMADSKVALFCSDHAAEGMIDVRSRLCVEAGCKKQPSKAAPGSNVARFCAGHAPAGAVRIRGGKAKPPTEQLERKRRADQPESGVRSKKPQPVIGGTIRAARTPPSAFATSAQGNGGAVSFAGGAGSSYDSTFRGLQEAMKEFVTRNGHGDAGGAGRIGGDRLGGGGGGLHASGGSGFAKVGEREPGANGASSTARFTAAAALLSLLPSMSGSSAKRRPQTG